MERLKSIQILRNKLTDVAVSAGEELLPAIIDLVDMAEPLVEGLVNMVKRFSDLDDATKQKYHFTWWNGYSRWSDVEIPIGCHYQHW